jgi:enoyl-CoA hydratase/carnithine racemase
MDTAIVTTNENGVLTIQMNRPHKKNALTRQMYADMAAALQQAEQDESVRVVLLTGTADCFTSGNDLSDFVYLSQPGEPRPVEDFLQAISTAAKPLVAAVTGLAVGVGVTMLMHCDLVYSADTARFRLPFVNLAVVPEAGSSLLLAHLVGARKAAELLMLGEWFSAATARELNFVNEIYPADELLSRTHEQIGKLLNQPPEALRLTKMLLKRPHVATVQETMAAESQIFFERLQSAEAQAVFQRFLGGG